MLAVMQGRLENNFPEAEVKVYHDLFYEFNKKSIVQIKQLQKNGIILLLTANLVADKKLQQEYLDYHATQFEKWPEDSKRILQCELSAIIVIQKWKTTDVGDQYSKRRKPG